MNRKIYNNAMEIRIFLFTHHDDKVWHLIKIKKIVQIRILTTWNYTNKFKINYCQFQVKQKLPHATNTSSFFNSNSLVRI